MHASCLCSGFVFNALAFIFGIFLSDMPITWSGSLLSAQRQCMMQCSDKNPLLLWKNCLQARHMNTSFPSLRQTKDYCLFVLPEKKMPSHLAHSSQVTFTIKTLFRFSLKHCLSKRSADWGMATALQFVVVERMQGKETRDLRSRSFLLIPSCFGLITYPL